MRAPAYQYWFEYDQGRMITKFHKNILNFQQQKIEKWENFGYYKILKAEISNKKTAHYAFCLTT